MLIKVTSKDGSVSIYKCLRAFADVEERDRPVSVLIGCDRPKIKIDFRQDQKIEVFHVDIETTYLGVICQGLD